jgi:hypothetical protein
MATVDTDQIQIAGTAPTYNAASAGGDKVRPGKNVVLHVKNSSAGAVTCTVVTPGTVAGQPIGDVAVSVPAGADRFIGPLTNEHFAAADGLVDLTWSATASVTFAAIRV